MKVREMSLWRTSSAHCQELLKTQLSFALKHLRNFRRAQSREKVRMKYVTCTELEFEELKLIRLKRCAIGGRTHHAFSCLSFRIFFVEALSKQFDTKFLSPAHETSKRVTMYYLRDFAVKAFSHS